MDINYLTQRIIGFAFKIHNTLGFGFLESVYENALQIELGKSGLQHYSKKSSMAHEVQLVNYLTVTAIDNGLLINFGPSVEVKRKFRQYKPRQIVGTLSKL